MSSHAVSPVSIADPSAAAATPGSTPSRSAAPTPPTTARRTMAVPTPAGLRLALTLASWALARPGGRRAGRNVDRRRPAVGCDGVTAQVGFGHQVQGGGRLVRL